MISPFRRNRPGWSSDPLGRAFVAGIALGALIGLVLAPFALLPK